MTALDKNPQTLNMLSQIDFNFVLRRAPALQFYVQRINLPGLYSQAVMQPTTVASIARNFDKVLFKPLEVTFKIDEKLQNYLEIHNWIKAIGSPRDTKGYANLVSRTTPKDYGVYSDISVFVVDSNRNPKFSINYSGAFPTSLSDVYFETDASDVQYITATATFEYTVYDIEIL